MAAPLVTPWLSPWWAELVKCAERGGYSGWVIVNKVAEGHSVGYPVGNDGFLVLDRAEDDALVVWLGVGRAVRNWHDIAESNVSEFARAIGCNRLRIEGRKGWRRILRHWTLLDNGDLELML